ncbi:peptidoglycan-binding protein [Streptomyces sp. NPDC102360]|uniref:peptidoglycan-binding protein n=1 Tax=Streptomyces sp. NPDC102360 TaxID=3366160 RepID=UPI00382501EA
MQQADPATEAALGTGERTATHTTRLGGEDVGAQVQSWGLERSYATDLPAAMRAFSGSSSAQLQLQLGGSGQDVAPALYSAWADRGTGDLARPGQSVVHETGVGAGETLPAFRGTLRSRSAASGTDTVHLVGHGRTNHAGSGSSAVYAAVRAERALPSPPGPDAVDGNTHFYGFEIENLGNGRDPYPSAQLAAVERLSAALCRAHGWTAASVIGHKEWTRRKIDPSFSMSGMRTRIGTRLGTLPVPAPPPAYARFPGASFFVPGRRGALITAVGKRLVAEGCGRYRVGPGPEWTAADVASYAAWQRKLGYSGADADGVPGRTSWDKLRVPEA